MKIVIPGGSGHLGHLLARAFHAAGDEVVVLSRNGRDGETPWRTVRWDGKSLGPWTGELEGADAVINLAGRSVHCRYHERNRRAIVESRVLSTKVIGEAIARAADPPRVWLQASTATLYSHRFDGANDEYTGIVGGAEPSAPKKWRFSIDVVQAWEQTFNAAQTPRTRKVAMRTSVVMSPQRGGGFMTILNLVRRGLGGRQGDGRQFVSWIHAADFVRAVRFLIEHDLEGPVIVSAPNPLRNEEFMRTLREATGRRIALDAPNWLLEIGAFFLRIETELVLKSRNVKPARLLDAGFRFRYPVWSEAAPDLVARAKNKSLTPVLAIW
jgi:hypothetical protein